MTKDDNSQKAGKGDYEVGYGKPPKNRQFGQPEGNPKHNGSWHKEDTARYKMETIIKMSDDELEKTKESGATTFERAFANVLYLARTATDVEEAKKCMDILDKMTNQVYGPMPQVQVAVEADDETKKETNKIIRGFALP